MTNARTNFVDAEIAAALAGGIPAFAPNTLGPDTLEAARSARAKLDQQADSFYPSDRVEYQAREDPPLTLRVHRPQHCEDGHARGCLYWMHGGGYILGSYDTNATELDRWCNLFDCIVVSVDYRLAPENPYPAAHDDCYAGLAWTFANADTIGVDRQRIGIGGGSAGGGLAAALALRVRDENGPWLSFQFLRFPMLDDRQRTPSSLWEDVPVWTAHTNQFGWKSYLGGLYGGDVPPYAAPARADELSDLPPTFAAVGTADVFVDECIGYTQRLIHARVPTELHVYPGATHGFVNSAPSSAVAQRAIRDGDDWLSRHLDRTEAR